MINYKKITVSYVYNPTVDEIFNALANKTINHARRIEKSFSNIKDAKIYQSELHKKSNCTEITLHTTTKG